MIYCRGISKVFKRVDEAFFRCVLAARGLPERRQSLRPGGVGKSVALCLTTKLLQSRIRYKFYCDKNQIDAV